jgi:hypothetical protein
LPDGPETRRGVDPLPSGPEGLVCSAKGCRQAATTDLRWNNPKIHTPDRRKHWLACDEHREQLRGFLGARGFLREVEPLAAEGDGRTG